ncbi:hypothetical protein GW17_00046508 [Ensete ventricosum]|nr:hypothetical protein GW17_00046508 [Ensete ventricosum]
MLQCCHLSCRKRSGSRKGRGSDNESSGAQLPKSKTSVTKEVDSEEHHNAVEADLGGGGPEAQDLNNGAPISAKSVDFESCQATDCPRAVLRPVGELDCSRAYTCLREPDKSEDKDE